MPTKYLRFILLLAASLLLSQQMRAVSLPALADSLTVFAQSRASVQPVTVKRIRTQQQTAKIYTCKTLSHLSLTPTDITALRQMVSRQVYGHNRGKVLIYTDGYEIGELLLRDMPHTPAPQAKGGAPLTRCLDRPFEAPLGLDGRHIALWASHGWYYNNLLDRSLWQRAKLWTTVEDRFTSAFTIPYLVPMLENAGAVVIQPRERDPQTAMVLADSSSFIQKDGFTGVEMTVPQDGDYAVYLWYQPTLKSRGESSPRTRVEVEHAYGRTAYEVNMLIGGGSWVYLASHHFRRSQPARLHIHTDSANILSVRLGGGTDSTGRVPMFMLGAADYLSQSGIPDSIVDFTEGENSYINDFACRGRWVNYLLGGSALAPKDPGLGIPVDLSLGLHSDAGTRGADSIVGTLLLYSDKDDTGNRSLPLGASRLQCRYLADFVQTQIVSDMRTLHDSTWARRELKNASYSESRNPKVPAILIEMLSHQNYGDMRYGLDPQVRFDISRAIYKGILRYLSAAYNRNYVVQPLPVRDITVSLHFGDKAGKDSIIVKWLPVSDPLEPTAKADYYVVQATPSDSLHTRQEIVSRHTRLAFPAERGVHYDIRVIACNKGGQSLPSPVHCAYIHRPDPSLKGRGGVALIVNAFDKVGAPAFFADSLHAGIVPGSFAIADGIDYAFIGEQYNCDRQSQWVSDDNPGWGASYCDQQFRPTVGNTHDYPTRHGRVLASLGYSYCSTTPTDWLSADTTVQLIDIILGKNDTLPHSLLRLISSHAEQGGSILLSGMNLASAIQQTADTTFIRQVIRGTCQGDHATRSGRISNDAQLTVALYTTPNPQTICCENPQGIKPIRGARALMHYDDTGMTAGIIYDGNYRLIALPFLLESAYNFDKLLLYCLEKL